MGAGLRATENRARSSGTGVRRLSLEPRIDSPRCRLPRAPLAPASSRAGDLKRARWQGSEERFWRFTPPIEAALAEYFDYANQRFVVSTAAVVPVAFRGVALCARHGQVLERIGPAMVTGDDVLERGDCAICTGNIDQQLSAAMDAFADQRQVTVQPG